MRRGTIQRRILAGASAGFSMIEVMIVVALIAFVYSVAVPQLNQRTGAEASQKVNQLASDFRSAYDLAVLTGHVYRLVFQFGNGDYWLEEADRPEVYLGSEKQDRDPTEREEKDERESFDAKFQEYTDLAGTVVVDQEKGKEIPPASPVVVAKDKLKKPTWTRVEDMEWSRRSLGPNMMVSEMQAEHHGQKQEIGEAGSEARGMIYIFPTGYIEKAYVRVAFAKDVGVVDDTQEPYTIITKPYEGVADVIPGRQEVDVHEDKDE